MNPTTTVSPPVIRAESSADFLALLPALTGYTVTNSLLVVLFSGNRSFGALRFDLPPSDEPRAGAELAKSVVAGARQLAKVDGVAIAIMTDQRSADRRPARASSAGGSSAARYLPWRNLARRLENRIVRAGLVLRDSCCVAADGWVSYLSPEPGGAMRPLSEIKQSLAGLEASLITDEAITSLEQMGALPEVDIERASKVRHAIDELASRSKPSAFAGPRLVALLARPGALATPMDTARLVQSSGSLAGWLRLVCAAMEAGVADFTPSGDLDAEEAGPISEANYIADCLDRGNAFDDPIEATRAFGPLEHALVQYAGIQPDKGRCSRAINLISEVTVHVPPEHQVGLRCVLAWLWWWTGLASVAARHIEEALQIEPEHPVATMLGHLIDNGMIPPWALAEAAACPASHSGGQNSENGEDGGRS